mgnify:FL=1
MTYAERVAELEAEGLNTSDAQGVADAEALQGREFDFDPAAPNDAVAWFCGCGRTDCPDDMQGAE